MSDGGASLAPDPVASSDSMSTIRLCNPVANSFSAFIFGNAATYERCFGERAPVVAQDSCIGREVVICGAGPSLNQTAPKWCGTKWTEKPVDIWGCNSGLTWLVSHGYEPTHGFAVDQTMHMLEEWVTMPDVHYLVASSVHVCLTEMLIGAERKFSYFHNFVGLKERDVEYDTEVDGVVTHGHSSFENWMYSILYPGTVCAGSGLNAVTRAIDVAFYMGYDRITVLGADCALQVNQPMPDGIAMGSPEHLAWLREHVVMHADGGSALASEATPVTVRGMIDSGTPDMEIRKGHGRPWETKPDMMISAVFLVRMRRKFGKKLRLMGDTLPNALRDKTDDYLDRLPSLTDGNGNIIRIL